MSEESPTAGLKVLGHMTAKYDGECCLVARHLIRKGDKIVRVTPRSAVSEFESLGWACSICRERIATGR